MSLFRVRSGSVLLVALLVGCPTPEPEPEAGPTPNQCRVDLLYSVETAQEIALGEEVRGTLCPARDVDWYRFRVEDERAVVRVHLAMDTHLTRVEPGYRLLKASGEPTGISARHTNRTPGERVDFEGAHRIDEPGTYIVTVADVEGFDDRFDIDNEYRLTVRVSRDPDENEPNDRAAEATPISSGTTVTGLIATTGDEDWYAIETSEDAQLLDVVARAPEDIGLDLVVSLFGPDALTAMEEAALLPAGGERRARLRREASGGAGARFYVRVRESSGARAQIDPQLGTYELVVTLLEDPDVQERGGRNDSVETATPAASGASFTGSLASRSDYDFFRIVPPGGTSRNSPRVLLVDVSFSGGVPADIQPQLRVLMHDPERSDSQLTACTQGCGGEPCLALANGNQRCGRVMLQRILTSRSSYRTGVPLRSTRPVWVALNDFGDDGFQESGTYTISFTILSDPDPGERGDDYLIPNLQFASYENDDELRTQTRISKTRARNITPPNLMPSCDIPPCDPFVNCPPPPPPVDAGPSDGGVDDGGAPEPEPTCLEVVPVSDPGPGGQVPWTVACSGEQWTMRAEGRLSYEGDRDFFRFDLPLAGYWALDLTYSTNRVSPVELAFFVHSESTLRGNYLEAERVGGSCESTAQCPPGAVCVDRRCWVERDDNPALTGRQFPRPGTNDCLYVHVNDTRPFYLEVVDNGINDFDEAMTYTFDILVRCGCPTACNGAFNACQGTPPP